MIATIILYVITGVFGAAGLYYVGSLPFGGFSEKANEERGIRFGVAVLLLLCAWFFAWAGGL